MATVTEWHVFDQYGQLTSIRYLEPPDRGYVESSGMTVCEVVKRADAAG